MAAATSGFSTTALRPSRTTAIQSPTWKPVTGAPSWASPPRNRSRAEEKDSRWRTWESPDLSPLFEPTPSGAPYKYVRNNFEPLKQGSIQIRPAKCYDPISGAGSSDGRATDF